MTSRGYTVVPTDLSTVKRPFASLDPNTRSSRPNLSPAALLGWLALLISLFIAAPSIAQVPDHPRLILDDLRIAELADLTHPSGPPAGWSDREKASHLLYRSIVETANYYMTKDWNSVHWIGHQGQHFRGMVTLALAHRLRAQEPYDNRYAAKLLGGTQEYPVGLLTEWGNQGYPTWSDASGLSAGELTAAWALVFDWMHPEMESGLYGYSVSSGVADLQALLADVTWAGWQGCSTHGNNHVGIALGGRGLAALALEGHLSGSAENARISALISAVALVRSHLDTAFYNEGSSLEGALYSGYGLNVALPFAIATDRLPHLTPSQRVTPSERNVQQSGTWYLYDQRPDIPFEGMPLNDTQSPSGPSFAVPHLVWPGWNWIMALGNVNRPSAALHHFFTVYPPEIWDTALGYSFAPDAPLQTNPSGGMPYSLEPPFPVQNPTSPLYGRPNNSPAAILLSLPDIDAPLPEFIGPDALRPTRSFEGQGVTYFRDSLHDVVDGELVADPDASVIVFQGRRPFSTPSGCFLPNWPLVHAQHDIGHFLLFDKGVPFFYDTGYGSRSAEDHNNCQVKSGGVWLSAEENYRGSFGTPLPTLLPQGTGPRLAGVDLSLLWPTLTDRARRSFFVLPRTDGESPYVVFHDDFDFAGASNGKIRWQWVSGLDDTAPDFVVDTAGDFTTLTLSAPNAYARTTLLSPSSNTITTDLTSPSNPYWNPTRRATVELAEAANVNQIVLVETGNVATPNALNVSEITTGGSGRFGFIVADGTRRDLFVCRRASETGTWQVVVGSHTLVTDADHVILRFATDLLDWREIDAGMFEGGTFVKYDDRIVAAVKYSALIGSASLSFSQEEVAVRVSGGVLDGYLVGPVVPSSAFVNRVEGPVSMLALPHPVATEWPSRVGRSPYNLLVDSQYRYRIDGVLRDGDGSPVSWDASKIYLEIDDSLPNATSGVVPDGLNTVTGETSWFASLESGGSGAPAGSDAVRIWVNYGDLGGWVILRSWDTISSPDQDGDNDIDSTDYATWHKFQLLGLPLYIGDLNLNGVVDALDYDWLAEHDQ